MLQAPGYDCVTLVTYRYGARGRALGDGVAAMHVMAREVAVRRLSIAFPHAGRRAVLAALTEADEMVAALTGEALPHKAEEVAWLRLEALYGWAFAAA